MIFKNVISWFEIPATDLNRAQNFYERIFGMKMTAIDLENIKMRLFPVEEPMGVGGSLVDSGGFHKPSASEGPLLYLNANPDVQDVLNKVAEAGGTGGVVRRNVVSGLIQDFRLRSGRW